QSNGALAKFFSEPLAFQEQQAVLSSFERRDGVCVGPECLLLKPPFEDVFNRDTFVAELDAPPLIFANGDVPAFLLRSLAQLALAHDRAHHVAREKVAQLPKQVRA